MARIRNAVDVVLERMYAAASVADQLAFDRYPDDVKAIARRAVALEIDKAADEGSSADTALGDALKATRLRLEMMRGTLLTLLDKMPADVPGSDLEVLRETVKAELAEVRASFFDLETAAEADEE